MSAEFKSWEEVYRTILRDDPGLFYIISHPTKLDRSRFMDKNEALKFVKDKIIAEHTRKTDNA